MGAIPAAFLPHRVSIEPFAGEGPRGATFGAAVPRVPALVESVRKRVLDDKGARVMSNTTVYMLPGTVCPARSRVTLPDGTTGIVAASAAHDGGRLPTPDHVEVQLI